MPPTRLARRIVVHRSGAAPFVVALAIAVGWAVPAAAFEVKVAELAAEAPCVRASVSLKDAFAPSFRQVLVDGGTLYLRIQAELWEDRAWDRLTAPRITLTFRIGPGAQTGTVIVNDPAGTPTTYPDYPALFAVRIDLAPIDRLDDARRYYVHAIATLGTSEGREIDDVGNVVFGSENDSSGLAAIGKYVFRKALEITDYFQAASSETTSRKWSGKEIRSKSAVSGSP